MAKTSPPSKPSDTTNVVPLPERKRHRRGFWREMANRALALPRRIRFGDSPRTGSDRKINPFTPARPLPGVVGLDDAGNPLKPNLPKLAMDTAAAYDLAMDNGGLEAGGGWFGGYSQNYFASAYAEGQEWLGYAVLAIMAQRAEYRIMTDTMATEMTREWITFKSSSGDTNKQKKIDELNARLTDLKLQSVVKAAIANDGFQGRGQIYLDVGDADDRAELKSPFTLEAIKEKYKDKIADHQPILKRVVAIEPMWCYPSQYNASDPLKPDWYNPELWWVMGKEVHRDRLLTFVGQPVSDMLKPAYSFGGLSLTQMAKPYVDFWLRNRTSESDLLNNFSVMALMTELDVLDSEEGSELFQRAATFNYMRDNQGMMLLNKESEDLKNVSAPISGVSEIVKQSMERMTLPSQIPIVKFFGNQPSGLNADSEGVIRMFYDGIKSKQEARIREPIQTIVNIVHLELWGEVDDDITFDFNDLWQLDEAGKSAIQKTRADQRAVDIEAGVISSEEGRLALAKDPDSQYAGLDLSEPLPEPDPGLEPDPMMGGEGEGEGGEGEEPESEPSTQGPKPSRRDFAPGLTNSAAKFGGATTGGFKTQDHIHDEWEEGAHPRGNQKNAGQFVAKGAKASHELPEHIRALKIPPAWTEVHYNPDPKGALQAVGRDVKGRLQPIFSAQHHAAQAAVKFARIKELDREYRVIAEQNEQKAREGDPRTKDAADCLRLIMATGIRPGSDTDTKAAKRAYGATTLLGKHVVERGGNVVLEFTGKKGVELKIPVSGAAAAMVLQRAKRAGPDGKLFSNTSGRALLRHVHGLDGGNFKTKDFRTYVGTSLAMREIARMPEPKNPVTYKKAVHAVATVVSVKLGNTPVIALQSYINPAIFAEWRMHSGTP